jgi:hypothetical protein
MFENKAKPLKEIFPQARATSLFRESNSRKLVRHRFFVNLFPASLCDVAFSRIEISQTFLMTVFNESNSRKLSL